MDRMTARWVGIPLARWADSKGLSPGELANALLEAALLCCAYGGIMGVASGRVFDAAILVVLMGGWLLLLHRSVPMLSATPGREEGTSASWEAHQVSRLLLMVSLAIDLARWLPTPTSFHLAQVMTDTLGVLALCVAGQCIAPVRHIKS